MAVNGILLRRAVAPEVHIILRCQLRQVVEAGPVLAEPVCQHGKILALESTPGHIGRRGTQESFHNILGRAKNVARVVTSVLMNPVRQRLCIGRPLAVHSVA